MARVGRLLDELARGGALRAERALVDRRVRVALDVDELAAAGVDELAAADGAVRADAACDAVGLDGAGRELLGLLGPDGGAARGDGDAYRRRFCGCQR